jgi:FkbM family methyltransferase
MREDTGAKQTEDDVTDAPLARPIMDTDTKHVLLEKLRMEAAMLAAPQDVRQRRDYFDLLIRFAGVHTGLSHALLPEVGHPLYFRCGSTDILNLVQIFRDGAFGFPMRASPATILDLGAYAGYAAVWLARRFPQARIACVEPCASTFRLLTLNATPYRNIRTIQAAAWHSNTTLGVAARHSGDWGTQLHDQMPQEARGIQALSVAELLRLLGWDHADFVKCDIEGAERAVFADPGQHWLHRLDVLAIELHDSIAPGSSETVANCFDSNLFETGQHGEAMLFQRRVPYRALPRPEVAPAWLIGSEPGLHRIALRDVPQAGWGFFTFDGDSCQLHPNGVNAPAPCAIFPRVLDGYTSLSATLHHAGAAAADIVFTVSVLRADGSEAVRETRRLSAGQRHALAVGLPALQGEHRVVLQTEMAPGAANNHNAWARWLAPVLT